jgi:hypothetical protein
MFPTCVVRRGFDQGFTNHCHLFTVMSAIFHKLMNNSNITDFQTREGILNCVSNVVSNLCAAAHGQTDLLARYIFDINSLKTKIQSEINKTIFKDCDASVFNTIIFITKDVDVIRTESKDIIMLRELIQDSIRTRDVIPISLDEGAEFYRIAENIYKIVSNGNGIQYTDPILPPKDVSLSHSVLAFSILQYQDKQFALFSSSSGCRFGALELELLLTRVTDFDDIKLIGNSINTSINNDGHANDSIFNLPYSFRPKFGVTSINAPINNCNWRKRTIFNQDVYICDTYESRTIVMIYRTIDNPRILQTDIRIEDSKTGEIISYDTKTGEINFNGFGFGIRNILTGLLMTPKFPEKFSNLTSAIWEPQGSNIYTFETYTLTKRIQNHVSVYDANTNIISKFNILSGILDEEDTEVINHKRKNSTDGNNSDGGGYKRRTAKNKRANKRTHKKRANRNKGLKDAITNNKHN